MTRVAVCLGTRPEIIKCAPLVEALIRRGADVRILHTGQHYAGELDRIFFHELGLPEPAVNLEVGSLDATNQVATILSRAGEVLRAWSPEWAVVQGDTNSVLGCALAAFKVGVAVAHLEAGLRSDDWSMPEEGNRVLTGRLAALHFCPTETQRERLAAEGITRGVHVVGNTIVDASIRALSRSRERHGDTLPFGLAARAYALVTLHRPSNVDDDARLAAIVHSLEDAGDAHALDLVWPLHPRARARVERIVGGAASRFRRLRLVEPLGYLDMQRVLASAELVLTDSGGVQEEACIHAVPCVTLRANTERPETVVVGANRLCPDATADAITAACAAMRSVPRAWSNPLGDGTSAERCADILLRPETRRAPSGAA